jgi:5-oxoprolinase (ATP-hydrolysing)
MAADSSRLKSSQSDSSPQGLSLETSPSSEGSSHVSGLWEFWIDRGGTFTDLVAMTPSGKQLAYKLLSVNPDHYEDAAIEGIKRLLSKHPDEGRDIRQVKMGTTVATNALLERKGEPVLLMISRGLEDQLEIGYQTRPDIFAVHIDLASPLYDKVVPVAERILADGTIDLPLDEETVVVQLQEAREQGYRSIAVALMHAYRYPQHEQTVGQIAREMGFEQVSLSHEISPLIKMVPRGQTTVADAYLTPVLKSYVDKVEQQLRQICPTARLEFMQSNGGLTDAEAFQGKDAVLSGPAGGVVGMVKTAAADGFERLIGFDMGGTSTDVSHFAGELERETETLVAGARLRVPMMNIHTVAAGGGSIVHFTDGRLQVGPESAGAFPGPACYRNGGPLTVTDCNLLLGKLQADHFPAIFGPQQNQPLDLASVTTEFEQLAEQVSNLTGHNYCAASLAEAFIAIAVDSMASAAQKISVQRGYDVRDYVLSAFGGAGAQHACLVAQAMGMRRVYLHPMAGVLSAFGIGLADRRWVAEQALALELTTAEESVAGGQPRIAACLEHLAKQSPLQTAERESRERVYLRYQGADTQLLVDLAPAEHMRYAFEAQHQQLFGFYQPEAQVWIDAVQLEHVVVGRALEESESNKAPITHAEFTTACRSSVDIYLAGERRPASVLRREALPAGFSEPGPMLITEPNSTLIVEPGWRCSLLSSGALLLETEASSSVQNSTGSVASTHGDAAKRDPMQLEIFNHLFMSVAEQMGRVLERTASSVNIKERLDFSCALFDANGELVANAPHIPVHLGSMSESVQVVMKDYPSLNAGDALVLNTPYNGGTHLPDVTVVRPVFITAGEQNGGSDSRPVKADFYVAARGHHADIGGVSPGSMPANSTHIEEEGVLLESVMLVKQGEFQQESIVELLTSAKYPARNPAQNLADLRAQLAACATGEQELERLCKRYGLATVRAYMAHVQDNAEETLRQCLAELHSGDYHTEMDDGSQIQVRISVDNTERRAVVDFSGTGYRPEQPLHPGNFNAPESVVRAAVLYSFRALVARPIPLNAGFFRALDIRVPQGSMIAPQYPAAVVSGNVETAQYLVDTIMGALGLMAGSQGTNNNFTFGNQTHQYYETICGGAGASAEGPGASGVHTHMTNSRLTDPEVLEQRFPVVLEHFHLRPLSGGKGQHAGGDGVERHIRFLEPMTANIISGHRRVQPNGLSGGGNGQTGVNFVIRKAGRDEPEMEWLDGCARVELAAGDVFCIHTPGGGGFGNG